MNPPYIETSRPRGTALVAIFWIALISGAAMALALAGCQTSHSPTNSTSRLTATTQSATTQPGYIQPDADDVIHGATDAGSTGAGIGAAVGTPFGQTALGGLVGYGVGAVFGAVITLIKGKQTPTNSTGTLNVIHTIAQDAQQLSPILGALMPNGGKIATTIGDAAGVLANATNVPVLPSDLVSSFTK